MYINLSRRFQVIKRWFWLLRGLKKARESLAPKSEGTWDSEVSTGRVVKKLEVLYVPMQKNSICTFAYLTGVGEAQEQAVQFPTFQAFQTAVGEGVVEYLEERQAEFSEVYFPFITFLSIGEPGWE